MAETKFARLKERENVLDACIRCGYCFEQCPIYKHSRWESDAPRSKLIMAFGLLQGEIEPSDYLAEKFFECFYCKRCSGNCSSGVPVTDIFSDAKADLIDAGFTDSVGTTSETDNGNCARCLACVRVCSHEAKYYDEKIKTDKEKCQGCGVCIDVCPRMAISVKGFGNSSEDIRVAYENFLKNDEYKNSKAVIFSCNWSSYPGFQNSDFNVEDKDSEYKIFVNVCGGRLEMVPLLEAFLNDAWGIIITVCPEGECEHEGNQRASERISALQNNFKELGMVPERIKLVEIPKGGTGKLKQEINTFMDTINKLGPVK